MKKFLLLYAALLMTLVSADTVYDIRGDSPCLDDNLSRFLHDWRTDTITPIKEGKYSNVHVNGNTTEKRIALTFDDSPDENNTDAVLKVLKQYGIQASFFMIGSPMQDTNATAVIRAHEEGHLVLNHSFTHPRLTACPPPQLLDELHAAGERIHSLIGKTPRFLRPPYGSLNAAVLDAINTEDYATILWSLDSLDWAIKEPEAIITNVTTNIRPGDIILMHSSRSNRATVLALGPIIEKLHAMGYRFERLDNLLGIEAYR